MDGITTKLFEAKSSKSYESYELMARYIGKGSLVAFVEPLKKVSIKLRIISCMN